MAEEKGKLMKLQIGQNWNMAKYQSGWRNGVLMEITELPDEGMNECIFLINGKLETYWIGIDNDGDYYWNEEDKTIGMVYYGEHCLVMKSIN